MNTGHIMTFCLCVALGHGGAAWAESPAPTSPAASTGHLLGKGWGTEHVIVMTKEIEATRNAFAALGFSATPVVSVSKVLLHSLIRFENGTYLELTQFIKDPKTARKEAASGHLSFLERYADFVLKREGGKHVGIEVSPAAGTTKFLRERGFEVTDPIGDNSAWDEERSPKPEWFTVDFKKPKGVTEWLSFIEYSHHDEMLKMQQENQAKGQKKQVEDHFNTATGLSEVWLAVKNLEAQAKLMEQVGFVRKETVEKPHLGAKGIRFDSGRVSLVLLTPTGEPKGILKRWLDQHSEGIFGARAVVIDIRRAMLLVRERIPDKAAVIAGHGSDGGRGFVVDGNYAGGLFLELWMNN